MIEDLHLRSKQSVSHAICNHDILFRLKPVGVNINIWDYCTCRMEYVQVYSILFNSLNAKCVYACMAHTTVTHSCMS